MSEKKYPSDTFCLLPWVHLSTRPDGSMRVCCTANASSVGPTNDKVHGGQVGILKTDDGKPNNLNVSDFETAWNSNYMKNVRLQMLNGEKPPSCTKCYKEEASGHNSKRMWETNYWSKRVNVDELIENTSEDGGVPPQLAYIDLRFGTKCQLACVMCSPHDSSGWIKDYKKIFPEVKNESLKETMQWADKGSTNRSSYNWHKQNPKFWKQFYEQMPSMQQIYFAGGESLIIEEHYEILEYAISNGYAKNLELRYNSNGVEWRDDLFDLWKEFKLVRFHYSVDSIGSMNDYIRYPSNWSRQKEVFHILDTQTSDNVEVTVACAVQALNIYYLPDFIRWKLEQGFTKINMWPFGAGGINYHFVYHPPHLNVKVLPEWFKAEVRKKYEEFYPWWEENWEKGIPTWHKENITQENFIEAEYGIKRLQGMLQFMESEDWSIRLPELKEYLSLCDRQRNNSFSSTFVEMKDIFKDI
ncbi:twitch domain-containing radical SAM protein [bacterium]|nr:twitch domain-containing radical SAM protein [bacterium]